ncbi:MAG TPA: acyltransferase [Patescibacteria group bacterium]|nr:acyltransferase [Patescibacteria group bacterium]
MDPLEDKSLASLPQPKTDDLERIAVLDGLRALAITLVFIFHFSQASFDPNIANRDFSLARYAFDGWVGVNLFFVISGFLIIRQLSRVDNQRILHAGSILYFFRKRLFRIVPAYYSILTALYISDFLNLSSSQISVAVLNQCYIFHLLLVHDILCTNYYPVFWSVATEAQFYLLAPFIVEFLHRYRSFSRILILLVLMMLSALYRCYEFLPGHSAAPLSIISSRGAIEGFLAGMLTYFLWINPSVRARLRLRSWATCFLYSGILLLVLSLGLYPPIGQQTAPFEAITIPSFLAIGFALMLLGLLGRGFGYSLFTTRPLKMLALISYGFYLTHLFTIFAVKLFLGRWVHNKILLPILVFVLGFALACGTATLLYVTIENPLRRYGRKGDPSLNPRLA